MCLVHSCLDHLHVLNIFNGGGSDEGGNSKEGEQ